MIHSRITAKAQTTVPRAVRQALGVGPGDDLAYHIGSGRVVLTSAKATQSDSQRPDLAAEPVHDTAAVRAAIQRMRRRALSLPGGPLGIDEIVEIVREGRR